MNCTFNNDVCRYISCPLWNERLQKCRFTMAVDKILGDDGKRVVELTPREQGILDLIAQGYTNKQIGIALSISYQCVKNHVSNILLKLGVHSRTGAVVLTLNKK